MLRTIVRPYSYLKIKHPSKRTIDWVLPTLMAVTITTLTFFGDYVSGQKLGWSFLKNDIASLVGILPGFYIAALSAIVVFNRNDIDKHMPKPTPLLKGEAGEIVSLTRRRFLAITFSFLTAESISLLIMIGLAPTLKAIVSYFFKGLFFQVIEYGYIFIMFLTFSQLIVVTFLCLYYLGERLHQPDP